MQLSSTGISQLSCFWRLSLSGFWCHRIW